MTVEGSVCGDENAKEEYAAKKAPEPKECRKSKGYYPDEFEGIPKLVVLLCKVGNSHNGHIK